MGSFHSGAGNDSVCCFAYHSRRPGADSRLLGCGSHVGPGDFLSLGGTFFIARLSSPAWALIIIAVFYVVLVVDSQVAYFDLAERYVYREVQEPESDRFPREWRSLDPDAVYQQWTTMIALLPLQLSTWKE